MFAENAQAIKDAVECLLRVSGSTTLTLNNFYDYIEQCTNMPDLLWPHEPLSLIHISQGIVR